MGGQAPPVFINRYKMKIISATYDRKDKNIIVILNGDGDIDGSDVSVVINGLTSGMHTSTDYTLYKNTNGFLVLSIPFDMNKRNEYFDIADDSEFFNIAKELLGITVEWTNGDGSGGEDYHILYDDMEMYEYKVRMLSASKDYQNTVKLARKMNAFSFLEQMLIESIRYKRSEDAQRYYDKMMKLAKFGYSNVRNIFGCRYINTRS